ncbi:MFS transporter [Actinosynnema sp. NPDC047251]|uniref:Paraquat/multidrug resistance efflux pump n=1 Tax=Saccharothrix espanaensis (strain ATCC 51144 / DSM 44229 / JCM 9112 / NBRC 15066 / NRRL 15764) TaxID=1179773 RepID=K0JXI2_SACES|nr:MFS transporter [Saccharothrix espanaensis]CCH30826.1 Paraquat/multidrug resistance efflux pump [Saccharothrix espanaensis DSM 44229]
MRTTPLPRAQAEHHRPAGRWPALGVLVLAVMMVAVNGTVLALATPFLSEDLRPTGTQLLWIGDVYAFVLAGLLVSMGSLGDRIGRKKLLMIGTTAFGLASLLIAYAPTAEALIAGRAVQGIAGATLMPSTLALVRNIFHDPRERSTAIGIWGAALSAGAAASPLLGGWLLEHFWWGSVFLINVPLAALVVVAGVVLLPESKNPAPGPWDLPSVLLSVVGVVGIVYAIKEFAVHGPRPDAVVAAPVGLAALVLFVRRQVALPSPLIDVRLFRNRVFTGVVGANLLSIFGLSGLIYFLSQYFQLVRGYGPLHAGLAEMPAMVASMAVGLLAGWTVRRTSVRVAIAGGLGLTAVAMLVPAFITPTSGYPALAVSLFLMGGGTGLTFTAASDLVLSSVPKEQAGAASAVSETAYELGMALGIAVLGSLVMGVYRGFEVPAGTPPEVAEAAGHSLGGAVQATSALPADLAATVLTAARAAFTDGLAVASGIGAALLFAATAMAWFMLKPRSPENTLNTPA